jgi:hypothetical protein
LALAERAVLALVLLVETAAIHYFLRLELPHLAAVAQEHTLTETA